MMYTIYIMCKECFMIRTQIYLTVSEKRQLEKAAHSRGVTQSDLIRQAVDALLADTEEADRANALEAAAGIWGTRNDIPDSRSLREGWKVRGR